MSQPRVLIADDLGSVRESLREWLSPDFAVEAVESGEACLETLDKLDVDLLLLDQRLPGISGMDVLRAVAARFPEVSVLMMTAYGTVDEAVEAVKLGAEDYLLKPVEPDALRVRIDRILFFRDLERENLELRRRLEHQLSYHSILTGDVAMKAVFARIEAVARSDASVLITGESGTGKELVARALHQASERSARPFVSVACGAVPDTLLESELFGHEKGSFTGAIERRVGKFEEAADGTLFLDEIAELSEIAQVKFLRVLQEREFRRVGGSGPQALRARIVSATNQDIDEAVETEEFREDLFYRVNTVRIDLPPLRNRVNDVALLAQDFLGHFAQRYRKPAISGFDAEAMAHLQRFSWPGNVRQLRGVVEQAVILCQAEAVTPRELPDFITRGGNGAASSGLSFHQRMDDHGRRSILEALEKSRGVKRDAARLLGLSPRALSHYLKKYGITS